MSEFDVLVAVSFCFKQLFVFFWDLITHYWFLSPLLSVRVCFFIDYIMGGSFVWSLLLCGSVSLYVLLDEFSLTLFLAAAFVKKVCKGWCFHAF